MAKRGAPRKQPRTIKALAEIASWHGYKVVERKKAGAKQIGSKAFMPDLIAIRTKGKGDRAFEVEKTITNNTIYKSIASLMEYLCEHKGSFGYLVVPEADVKFASGCLAQQIKVIRKFEKTSKGADRKIPLGVISFEQVSHDEAKLAKWAPKRVGQPPKCSYLPR